MEIGEIISDAAMYPINNVKALVIYVVLGIVAFLALIQFAASKKWVHYLN